MPHFLFAKTKDSVAQIYRIHGTDVDEPIRTCHRLICLRSVRLLALNSAWNVG